MKKHSPLHQSLAIILLGQVAFAPNSSLAGKTKTRAIYGEDDRIEISDIDDPKIAAMSRAVVAIGYPTSWQNDPNDGNQIRTAELPDDLYVLGLRDNRRFSKQAPGAFCTGFLVSPSLVMTAGHCVSDEETCDSIQFVFDFVQSTNQKSNVKKCKTILKESTFPADYALIELEEPQFDRPYFKLTADRNRPQVGTKIAMLGHPDGRPMKFVGGDQTQVLPYFRPAEDRSRQRFLDHSFITNLDAFHGNSGSPVFNPETLELLGILVAGAEDTDASDSELFDYRYPQFPSEAEIMSEKDPVGEIVTSIAKIRKKLVPDLKALKRRQTDNRQAHKIFLQSAS